METEKTIENGGSEERRLTKAERKLARKEEKKRNKELLEKKKQRRRITSWIAAVLVIGAVIGGSIIAARNNDGEKSSGETLALAVSDEDWIKGNPEARVTLVEYADYQCPACANFYPVVSELIREHENNLRIVYRHYPLRSSHPNAQVAANAAEAAGQQGKFWEMSELLYERQSSWSSERDPKEQFAGMARELELNEEQFKGDLEREDLSEKIDRHYSSGLQAGVNSTPTFFLNGEPVQGYSTIQSFKDIVSQAIENVPN